MPQQYGVSDTRGFARMPSRRPCPECSGEIIDRGFGKPPERCDDCRTRRSRAKNKDYAQARRERTRQMRERMSREKRTRLAAIIDGSY